MNDEVKQDAGEAPAQPAEAPVVDPNAALKALYEAFSQASVASGTTNANVANAAIYMLCDALSNMTLAAKMPQPVYNAVMDELVTAVKSYAQDLSHQLAEIVAAELAPPETVASLADADMSVEN